MSIIRAPKERRYTKIFRFVWAIVDDDDGEDDDERGEAARCDVERGGGGAQIQWQMVTPHLRSNSCALGVLADFSKFPRTHTHVHANANMQMCVWESVYVCEREMRVCMCMCA